MDVCSASLTPLLQAGKSYRSSRTQPAPEFVPSPYAGRNEIFLNAAAGRGQEADGGSTRGAGRSETYTLWISSIRDKDHPWQAFPSV
jgi:hypothetical protein